MPFDFGANAAESFDRDPSEPRMAEGKLETLQLKEEAYSAKVREITRENSTKVLEA